MAPSRDVGDRPNGNGSTDRLLGELIAEVRTVKHNQNNTSTKVDGIAGKVDALALVVATQGQLRDHVERLERQFGEQESEIDELKAVNLRREGAVGLFEWISKHWPFLGLCAFLIFWVGLANGMFKGIVK